MPITSDELRGDPVALFPQATVACFDPTLGQLPRRQLDDVRTVDFLERLATRRVPAVLIAASTGHGHLRTVHELGDWFRCAAAAGLEETMRMALLRPEDGLDANRELVALLSELDFPVVFFRPGTNLGAEASVAQCVDHLAPYLEIAAAARLAIGVYSISDVSGVALPADAVAQLLDCPGGDHLVACKITEADYTSSTLTYLRHPRLQHLKIVQGWDPHLAQALRDGPQFEPQRRQRCGMTSGPMSFAVDQYLHVLAAAHDNQWDEVAAAQDAVTRIFSAMQDDPRKFADLQRAKYIMGLGQPLTATVSEPQVERVFAALAQLPRKADRRRLASSLDLMGDGPYHERLLDMQSA